MMIACSRKIIVGLALFALLGAFGDSWNLQSTLAQTGRDTPRQWTLKAQRPLIVGSYGDNFSYDGSNARPLTGTMILDIDVAGKTGSVVARIQTTPESGPLFISQSVTVKNGVRKVTNEYLEGNIRLEMHIDDTARLQEYEWLHGNTGNEAPVLPDLFNFLAGWAPLNVYVDDQLAYEGLAGHFMYSEQMRREDGTIRREDGTIYSPILQDKSRFTNAKEREFHLVAHTTVPDENNFPPHTHWIHLVFFDVFAQQIASTSTLLAPLQTPVQTQIPMNSSQPGSSTPTALQSTPGGDLSLREPGTANSYVILMRNEGGQFFFDPVALHLQPNDEVIWFNLGDNHSATAYAPPNRAGNSTAPQRIPEGAAPWDSGILGIQGRGLSFSHTYTVPGTYDYYCLPHEFLGMVGRIVVDAPGGPAETASTSGISGFADEVLQALPSAGIVSAKGVTYNWAGEINVVLLRSFENDQAAATAQAQRLVDNAAVLAPLLRANLAQFKTLLDQYAALTQTQAGFAPLAAKADELKALLAEARK